MAEMGCQSRSNDDDIILRYVERPHGYLAGRGGSPPSCVQAPPRLALELRTTLSSRRRPTTRTPKQRAAGIRGRPDVITCIPGDAEGATRGVLASRPRYRTLKTREGRSFDFVSGRIDTKGKFEFTRGRAAARTKVSIGAGLRPAFWILGTGRWPATGEIDVMDHVGEPDNHPSQAPPTGLAGSDFFRRSYNGFSHRRLRRIRPKNRRFHDENPRTLAHTRHRQ